MPLSVHLLLSKLNGHAVPEQHMQGTYNLKLWIFRLFVLQRKHNKLSVCVELHVSVNCIKILCCTTLLLTLNFVSLATVQIMRNGF
jgi:hypothetical protein